LNKRSNQDIIISQIPLNPPFSKGEVFHLPLVSFPCLKQAKGGGEGFYEAFFKELKCYKESFFPVSLIFGAKLLISETGDDMVIDNADGLKMGINDRRTYESEASMDQILTDLIRE